METRRLYKAGSKVRMLRAANAGDEAIILERIETPGISMGQYASSRGGVLESGAAQRYRVQVIRTGQELLEDHERLEPCDGTEYENE